MCNAAVNGAASEVLAGRNWWAQSVPLRAAAVPRSFDGSGTELSTVCRVASGDDGRADLGIP